MAQPLDATERRPMKSRSPPGSSVAVLRVRAREDLVIAREVARLLR